jgi:cytochrome P450
MAQLTAPNKRPRRVAPGPHGDPFLGSFRELQRLGQVRFYLNNWRAWGDLVRFRIGPLVAHIVIHPDAVQRVLAENQQNYGRGLGYAKTRGLLGLGLLTSEGEVWRRQRRLMQPLFTSKAVSQYAGDMTAATEAMLEQWQAQAERGETVDINLEMLRLAMRIIGRTMFGIGAGQASVELDMVQSYEHACEFINARLASFFDIPLFIPTPFNRRFTQSIATLDRLIYQLIRERRNQQNGKADLMSKLLAARDEETGEGMSDRQIRDEVITVFFAGHETTAEALTWAWYLLAQNPEAEQRLHTELRVLGGRTPTVQDLPNLPYTRMVIEETLRLYPPVWTFPRQAIQPDQLQGYDIPGGSLIFPSQYLTHRHANFWENPEAFEPERFTPKCQAQRPRHAYYPFGGGARTCIGIHFAMQEACLVLATVAQRYRLRLVSTPPIEPRSVITLHPSQPVQMRIELR